MIYKELSGNELKKNYPTKLELNTEKTFATLTLDKISSDESLNFYFKEKIKGNYSVTITNLTEKELKAICMIEIKNIIISKSEEVNLLIYKENDKFFKNRKKLKELYIQQSKLQALIVNNNNIKERIVILKEKIEDDTLFITPVHFIEKNQNVYIVSQNFNSYLDIVKYKVKEVTITDTKYDNQYKTEFEFCYTLIDENENILEIDYKSFRSFNGKKAIINDKFLFVDVKDAKNHCVLVLKNLQNNISEKIEIIYNYEK